MIGVNRHVSQFLESTQNQVLGSNAELLRMVTAGRQIRIQTVNLHHLYLIKSSSQFRAAAYGADYVTPDGWPLVLFYRSRGLEVERVTGSDLVRSLVQEKRSESLRVALLGSSVATGEVVADLLSEVGWDVVFREHGDARVWDGTHLVAELNGAKVDLVLIAVSPPAGELVGHSLRNRGYAGVTINVGGGLDMCSGEQTRAPYWAQAARLEWFYRLLRDPRRLFKRYVFQCGPVMFGILLDMAAFRRGSPSRVIVAHVGLMGDEPGGMAQVVNGYLRWNFDRSTQVGVRSTRRRHDIASPLLWAASAFRLVSLAARMRQLVVVVHLSERGSFLREGSLLVLAAVLRVPRIAHLHGANFVAFSRKYPRLAAKVLSFASSIFLLTEESRQAVRSLGRFDASLRTIPIQQVPNLVTVGQPERRVSKEKIILFAGEVGQRKGADLLMNIWSVIYRFIPGWRLVVAGPVVLPASDIPVLPGMEVCGSLPHEEVLQLQERAAVAVLPSTAEALPVFLIEAMEKSCAVIATSVGQIPDLLNDGAGILVAPRDMDGLGTAILAVCGDVNYRTTLGATAHSRVRHLYGMEAQGKVLEQMWIDILSNS